MKSNGDVTIKLTLADGDVTLEWAYSPSGPDSPYDVTVTVPGPSQATIEELRKVGASADLATDVPAEVYDDIHAVVHSLRREIEMGVSDDDKAIIVEALVEAICE
jgi:hypothetical protein